MKKVKIDEILMPGDPKQAHENEEKVKSGFLKKAKAFAARIPFMEDVFAAYYCALDPETPAKVRGIVFASLAYFVLPLDMVPDFIAGFGLTDDIAVLTAAFTAISGHIKESHRQAARNALSEEETPKSE